MIIKKFRLSGTEQIQGYSIANLISEDAQDWYEAQSLFEKDKLKFEFDENGIITRFSYDVSMLWPIGKSVADISKNLVPDGLRDNGEWMFDGEKSFLRPSITFLWLNQKTDPYECGNSNY